MFTLTQLALNPLFSKKKTFRVKKFLSLLILLFTSWFHTYAQLRNYSTRNYANYQEEASQPLILGDSSLPLTLSLTFILLTNEVTQNQLVDQVASLNNDFSKLTFDNAQNKNQYYSNLATDTGIRFCVNFETVEAFTSQTLDTANAQTLIQRYTPTRLNRIPVFITDLDRLAGFTYPISNSTEPKAIFLDKDYLIGSATIGYALGKTLTHLIGNFLGLGRLGNCEEDGIADTPKMASEHYEHESGWSACYGYVVQTMPENFMYNTQDQYLNMFTLGQKKRMLLVLTGQKSYLINTTTCE